VQHQQEAEVAAAEERERAVAETATTAARAARLVMTELAAARAEVEVAAAAAELTSSTGNSVSADDDRDNELKLTREAAREQAAQWAAAHPQDVPAAGLTEITAFTGGATLPPRTGTMGSRPLSGTSVPAAGGLPSPRPTTSSGPR
jgi:hypothetical protein